MAALLAEETVAREAAAACASSRAGGGSDSAAAASTSDSSGGNNVIDGAKNKNKKFKGVFKALKGELAAVKERWGANAKIFFKRPPPPWPVKALRILPKSVSSF